MQSIQRNKHDYDHHDDYNYDCDYDFMVEKFQKDVVPNSCGSRLFGDCKNENRLLIFC